MSFDQQQKLVRRLAMLQNITVFCRKVYYSAFGPVEGEERFRNISFQEALALWKAGLPQSLEIR